MKTDTYPLNLTCPLESWISLPGNTLHRIQVLPQRPPPTSLLPLPTPPLCRVLAPPQPTPPPCGGLAQYPIHQLPHVSSPCLEGRYSLRRLYPPYLLSATQIRLTPPAISITPFLSPLSSAQAPPRAPQSSVPQTGWFAYPYVCNYLPYIYRSLCATTRLSQKIYEAIIRQLRLIM